MGVDPVTMFAASAAIGAVSSAVGGIQSRNAANKQAGAAMDDAWASANNEIDNAKAYSQKQEVGFLSSGVDLSGSPLLVMQETLKRGANNANTILAGGQAQADTLRQKGSDALKQGIIGGLSSVASAYTAYQGYQAKYGTIGSAIPNSVPNYGISRSYGGNGPGY